MKITNLLSNAYYDYIAKSTASLLNNKKCTQDNPELRSIYASMITINSKPNFSAVEKILSPTDYIKENADTVGVIVETRKHPALEKVTTQFIQRSNLKVQLFHGTENLDYILGSGLKTYIELGQIQLCQLKTNQLNAASYNALFLTKDFWNAMIGRSKIFVFQTDSWLCEGSPYSLNDFLHFDYIGSKWPRKRPVGLVIDGGSGGLSIRDWRKSVQCLEMFPPTFWKGGEDGYFAFHIDLLGGKVARKNDCGKFSTQEIFSHSSFGAHQISLLPKYQQKKFLKYCPNASFLLK